MFKDIPETMVADIERVCGSCQSLDADTHGKVVALAGAFRGADAEIVRLEGEIARLRSAAKKKPAAKKTEPKKKATKKSKK